MSNFPSRFFEDVADDFSVVVDPATRSLRSDESIYQTQKMAASLLETKGEKQRGEDLSKQRGLKSRLVCPSSLFSS